MPEATDNDRGLLAVVVLAGGMSRRFGSDKLAADVGGTSLLDRVLTGLPSPADIVVVGDPRPTIRPVRFVREDPPGGGPAAAIVAGLCATHPDATVLVVPGDAPDSGRGTAALLAALSPDPESAVIATDSDDREQPLQLALRPGAVRALIELAGPDRGNGASARRLVLALGTHLHRHPLPRTQTYDIDTRDQLVDYSATRMAGGDRPAG